MKRNVIQTASRTFLDHCSDFNLEGHELCILEFDPLNDTDAPDRIYSYSLSSKKLLWGQLELPLNLEK